MNNPRILLAVLCLLSASLVAQTPTPPPMGWGEVPAEDLLLTVYPQDTSASALVLFDTGDMEIFGSARGIQYKMKRHRRIKILRRAGFEHADVSILFYKYEPIKKLTAQIFQPDGSKTVLEKIDFLDERIVGDYYYRKFTFPGVQEGSVIEYRYETGSEAVIELPDWYFQDEIPVRWSEYTVSAPDWFDYLEMRQGDGPDITRISPKRDKRYYAKAHAPAFKAEGFITTERDYMSRIRLRLKAVQWPSTGLQVLMTNWPNVAKRLWLSEGFGVQFQRKSKFSKAWAGVADLKKSGATDTEKVQRIYDFVNAHITWDEDFSIWAYDNLNKAFEARKGSTADINLTMLALLREAGVKAWPLLCSTREHGRMMPYYPILSQFNHVMVLAEADGKKIVLDGGNPFRPLNMPRATALNGEAWLVDPDSPSWMTLSSPGTSIILALRGTIGEGGDITGQLRAKYEGYEAMSHRTDLQGKTPADIKAYWVKQMAEGGLEAEFETAEMEHLTDPAKTLGLSAQCTIRDAVQDGGDLLYLPPTLIPAFTENPFKMAERTYPVDIPYPIAHQFVMQLEIPEGYTVEELPENLNLSLPDRGGTFQYTANIGGNMLNISYKLRIDQLLFPPEEYGGLKTFFDLMMAKQNEQVVLRKE